MTQAQVNDYCDFFFIWKCLTEFSMAKNLSPQEERESNNHKYISNSVYALWSIYSPKDVLYSLDDVNMHHSFQTIPECMNKAL